MNENECYNCFEKMINSKAKFQFPNELTEKINDELNYSLMDNRIFEYKVGEHYTIVELHASCDHRDAEYIELLIGEIVYNYGN